ncbi:MAG: alanine racemase [Chloroflexota bacterium]|nr:alanine racemase [Chloroflexota bacterium]
MIYLTHLLEATHGTLISPGRYSSFDAFSHDSRQINSWEMFVAIRGEHSDGHDYLLQALKAAATGLLVEERFLPLSEEIQHIVQQQKIALVAVPNTRIALQQYARHILQIWKPIVIAVTGSTGKTTTKEAIADVLARKYATFRSWQNYNDLLGIPLSLGKLEETHQYAVLELGCDHPGEMSDLCQLVRPQLGVLTNISPAQLQYFGTLERLAEEFGMLLRSLPADGRAFVNSDDLLIPSLIENCPAPTTPFTPSALQDVHVTWQLSCTQPKGSNDQPITLTSSLLGKHFITTMLAAYTVGKYCGMRDEEIQQALTSIHALPGRLNTLSGLHAATLLDDTHNATPASMIAGLETLKVLDTNYRIAILGDMFRLGSYEEEAHRLVGQKAAECADYLITRGERAAIIAESARQAGLPPEHITITSTYEDAAQAALNIMKLPVQHSQYTELYTKALILIKGSEETRMERVTQLLMASYEKSERLVRQTPGWKQIVVARAERPTWVEVDLGAITNNIHRIRELIGPEVRILASLKADAYGHGALKVARTVLHNGASMLGVATVSEAIPLREGGIEAPILVFGYVPLWQMREAVRLGLTITLYSSESAQALSQAARALTKNVKAHVKIDTGMGRLGIRSEQIDDIVALIREIDALPNIEMEGIFTHFAMADAEDQASARMQLARFQNVLQVLDRLRLRPCIVHAANSAAMISLPEARFDMVRPGIALYGLEPSADVRLPEGFRVALSFKTQVAQVKEIPAGEGISYGSTFITQQPTIVATLPVGYADGFRRSPSNWGTVLLHGQEAPILGRVCMDQCMIDVTHIPSVRVGDEVVLIGQQGDARLTAEEVARRLGTINYEVVAEILARVPRVD